MTEQGDLYQAIQILDGHLKLAQRDDDEAVLGENDFAEDLDVALPVYQRTKGKAELVVQYLDAFGYFGGGLKVSGNRDATVKRILDGLEKFQNFFGIAPTRDVDTPTLRAMENARCGCPDLPAKKGNYLALKAFAAKKLAKWKKSGLTWAVDKYLPVVDKASQDAVYADGFWKWCRLGNIDAKRVSDARKADIVIGTGKGPQSNFDGAGGVLAWAYLPDGSDSQLNMKFDLAEKWLLAQPGRGFLLANVFTHEVGHLFGLDHSKVKGSLMAPYYDAAIADPQPDDVAQFQKRYGKRPTPLPRPAQPMTASVPDKTIIVERGGRLCITTDGDVRIVAGKGDCDE